MSSDPTTAASTGEEGGSASTSGLPAAAKAAAEHAVKTAIAETAEEGEIQEGSTTSNSNGGDDSSSAKKTVSTTNGTSNGAVDANGIRTVFSDPANFNVVHPLYSKWCVDTLELEGLCINPVYSILISLFVLISLSLYFPHSLWINGLPTNSVGHLFFVTLQDSLV